MQFLIDYSGQCVQGVLKYETDEYSFDLEPLLHQVSFDLILNTISLGVDENNKIAQVWGFCPYTTWIKTNYTLPPYAKGELKVADNLECGFSYQINKNEEWRVYVNLKTGWICVGNPEKAGDAVEFITNCVAVINEDNELIAIWLRPQKLPQM